MALELEVLKTFSVTPPPRSQNSQRGLAMMLSPPASPSARKKSSQPGGVAHEVGLTSPLRLALLLPPRHSNPTFPTPPRCQLLQGELSKVNRGGRAVGLALLVAVGVDEEGCREVPAAEPAGWKRKEARRNPLKGQIERGLRGVRLGSPLHRPGANCRTSWSKAERFIRALLN